MSTFDYRPTVDQVMDALWEAAIYWGAKGHLAVAFAEVTLSDGETDFPELAEAA